MGKPIPESVADRAKSYRKQKGTVMHIASGLALVRRNPAQSDAAAGQPNTGAATGTAIGLAWRWTPAQVGATRARLRKMLPGAILLMALVLLGALFPVLF
jgi:hypothetical protein